MHIAVPASAIKALRTTGWTTTVHGWLVHVVDGEDLSLQRVTIMTSAYKVMCLSRFIALSVCMSFGL